MSTLAPTQGAHYSRDTGHGPKTTYLKLELRDATRNGWTVPCNVICTASGSYNSRQATQPRVNVGDEARLVVR